MEAQPFRARGRRQGTATRPRQRSAHGCQAPAEEEAQSHHTAAAHCATAAAGESKVLGFSSGVSKKYLHLCFKYICDKLLDKQGQDSQVHNVTVTGERSTKEYGERSNTLKKLVLKYNSTSGKYFLCHGILVRVLIWSAWGYIKENKPHHHSLPNLHVTLQQGLVRNAHWRDWQKQIHYHYSDMAPPAGFKGSHPAHHPFQQLNHPIKQSLQAQDSTPL